MSKPNNSIAHVKVPGENDQRPIVPYLIGATGHNYVASLPADMTADDTLALRSDAENTISIIEVADEDTPLTQDQIDKLNSGKYWLKELENGVLYQTVFNVDMYTYHLMCLDGINDEDIYIRYFWLDDIHAGDSISDFTAHSLWFTKVIANPLNNSGTNLEGVQIGDTKYKIPTGLELIDFGINTSTAIGSSNLAKLQEGKAILSFIYDEMPFIYYPISGNIMLRIDDLDSSVCYMYWFDPQDLTSNSTCNSVFNLETNYDINLVEANPTLAGTESALTGIKIGSTKYKIPTTPLLEETTWSALKTKRDNSQLVPGQFYRITDYTCTTTRYRTSSAGHVFDIIVRADSVNKFNEEASAIQHAGNTYFANNNLSAWKLWYCLDNDTNRFGWADSTNGKGVIYRMIDEFNNDIPYDFKNILFTGSSAEELITYTNVYTFSYTEDNTIKDASLLGQSKGCYNNIMKKYISLDQRQLNFNIFYSTTSQLYCSGNKIEDNCYKNTFKATCYDNILNEDCKNNTFMQESANNILGIGCENNIFIGSSCWFNTLGHFCKYNVFYNSCQYNTLGSNSVQNILGNYCSYNMFGDTCNGNKFGDSSSRMEYCQYNIIDSGCSYLYINGNGTASSSNQLQNIHIHLGVSGTSSNRKTITVDRGLSYSTDIYPIGSVEQYV